MSVVRSESIGEMPDDALHCRDWGHRWEHATDKITATAGRRVVEVSRTSWCVTCKSERDVVFELPSCEVKTRTYRYSDGYLLANTQVDGRRVNVRDVRREVFSRSGIKF